MITRFALALACAQAVAEGGAPQPSRVDGGAPSVANELPTRTPSPGQQVVGVDGSNHGEALAGAVPRGDSTGASPRAGDIESGKGGPPTPPACPMLEDVPAQGECAVVGGRNCSPGATETDDLAVICHQRTTVRRCKFDAAFRKAMGRAYDYGGSYCELDHVISLELGGSNEIANLRPQIAPDCHQKDAVEDSLRAAVCRGDLSLPAARAILLGDWRSYYKAMNRRGKR